MATVLQSCTECGGALPESARFCPACGTRIAAVAPVGERRQATILFADLSGYTRLSSELDPEETHRLLTRFFELVDAVITRWGGAIDKHIGDAVMAVFGAPIAYGNDIERALRAAADVHAAMTAVSADFDRMLTAHIGIASGEVVAASTGSAAHRTYTVTGDAVNLAARLTEMAHGGETVVSEEVQQAIGNLADFEALGGVAIRGLAGATPAFRALSFRGPVSESFPLVGRERERTRFAELVDRAAASGNGGIVVLRGDPGMGKTRLADMLIADAYRKGATCHAATILDFGTGQGRDAIHALTCSLLGASPDDDASARRAALDRALAAGDVEAVDEPFLADLMMVTQRAGTRYESMDNDARQRGKLRAIAHAVLGVARAKPSVLLIEDIHWASPWVLDALREIARSAIHSATLLVLTTRRDGDPIDGTWPREAINVFDLAPLDRSDALSLARVHLASTPDLAERCVERAQGNPLFLLQLLKSDTDESAVPPTIQSVVLARLDRLAPRDKLALQAAAVMGQRFGLAALRHLIGDPNYVATGPLERDLVRTEGSHGEQLMFTHALIRDGAYASLLHSARRDLHRAAAKWYEGRDLMLRAEHLDRAEDKGAAEAYLVAARAEVAAFRIDAALTLAERGASLDAPAPIGQALAMLEGELHRELGHGKQALAAFERARGLATDENAECAAWIAIASAHRVTSSIKQGLAALDCAEPLAVQGGLHRELARIGYLRGNLHFARGDVEGCRRSHERALAFAQQANDAECEALALSGLADALYAQGRLRSAYEAFQRCIAVCDREGLTRFSLGNRCMTAIIGAYFERLPDSLATLERALRAAREIQHRYAEAMALEAIAIVLHNYGRYAEAKPIAIDALAVAREIGARRFEAIDLYCLAHVLWREGAHDDARRHAELAWAISEIVGPRFSGPIVLGVLAYTAATPEDRVRFLAEGERLLREGCVSHCYFGFLRDAMETAFEAGAWSDALRYASELEAFMRDEPLPVVAYHIARIRALVAAGRGEGDRAELERCRRYAIDLGMPSAIPALDAALRACQDPLPSGVAR